jgi:hypothetical protein
MANKVEFTIIDNITKLPKFFGIFLTILKNRIYYHWTLLKKFSPFLYNYTGYNYHVNIYTGIF